jgi:hypothetical protein
MTAALEIITLPHWSGEPRTWRRVGSRYGRYGRVQIYQSTCLICSRPFEIAVMISGSKQFRRFTCLAHRFTWREAFSLWRKRKRASAFKRAFEKIKFRKLGQQNITMRAAGRAGDPISHRQNGKTKMVARHIEIDRSDSEQKLMLSIIQTVERFYRDEDGESADALLQDAYEHFGEAFKGLIVQWNAANEWVGGGHNYPPIAVRDGVTKTGSHHPA